MFDYDIWLSTPQGYPIDIYSLNEDEDRAYDECKDNVAMGYESKGKKKYDK